MCMINLCNSNNNDFEFLNLGEKYFPYYDFSKLNLNADYTLDCNLEYLELCNIYAILWGLFQEK